MSANSLKSKGHWPWRAALVVALISLVLRLAWAWGAHVTPVSDFAYYDRLARELINTGEFGSPDSRAFVTPGYVLLLAALYSLPGDDLQTAAAAHAVLGALASGLVVLLAARWFSRRVAFAAGLAYALAPIPLVYVPTLATENLAIPLLLASLLLADGARGPRRAGTAWFALLSGLLCGALLLVRAAASFVAPALTLALLYDPRTRRWSLARPVLFAVGVGVVLLPWTVRNWRLGLGFVPLSTSGPVGMYTANSASGRNGEWGEPSSEFARGLKERPRMRAYSAAVREWIRQNPARYAALCGTRLTRFLGSEADAWAARVLTPSRANDRVLTAEFRANWDGQPADPKDLARARAILARNMRVLRWLNVLLLSPLGLVALLLSLARWRDLLPLLLTLAAYIGGLTLTIASMRYRLLSDPLLFILIAALVSDLLARTRELGRRPGRAGKAILVLCAIALSIGAHATGAAERHWYQLAPMLARPPDTSRFSFGSVDLATAVPTWVYRTRTQQHASADGLHCIVEGTDDVSAAQYGGLALPVKHAEGLRLALTCLPSKDFVRLIIDLTDSSGARCARWTCELQDQVRSEASRELVLVPGQPCADFAAEATPTGQPVTTVHIFVEVAARGRTEFVLHRLQEGWQTPAATSSSASP